MDINLYRAFNNIDPFEDSRFDTVIASLMRRIGQACGLKGESINDCMIDWDPQEETEQEKVKRQRKLMDRVMGAFGRFFKKTDKDE